MDKQLQLFDRKDEDTGAGVQQIRKEAGNLPGLDAMPRRCPGGMRSIAFSLCVDLARNMKCIAVKSGDSTATVWLNALRQKSTEPYEENKDNQGGFQTAQYLWDSGLYLARWVLQHRARLDGKRVLELGSGLGLPGLIASKYAAETVLSDCSEDVVENLTANIKANTSNQQTTAVKASGVTSGSCRAMLLDWTKLKASSDVQPEYDVVLGSDCIYMVDMADLVASVVAHSLKPGGFALLVFPQDRPGVPEFVKLMRG